MPGKLKASEAGTLEARRIVCAHIADALAALKGKRCSDTAIHEARKSIKKARAVWKLLHPALPTARYQHANRQLRDAGKPLGTARDAKILVNVLDTLLKAATADMAARAASGFRRALMQEESIIKQAVLHGPRGIALSRRILRRARQYIKSRSIKKHSWAVLGKGLQRVYGRGRRLFRRAHAKRRTEDLHEWRKQVKYLHHQFGVLKPLRKGLVGTLADETGELSERLGDEHDLAVLQSHVLCQQALFASHTEQARLLAAIDARRAMLQHEAFVLGARIYGEKPRAFAARFGGYWHDWRRARR